MVLLVMNIFTRNSVVCLTVTGLFMLHDHVDPVFNPCECFSLFVFDVYVFIYFFKCSNGGKTSSRLSFYIYKHQSTLLWEKIFGRFVQGSYPCLGICIDR